MIPKEYKNKSNNIVCKTPYTVSEFVSPNSVSDFAVMREFLSVDMCDS
jgi:hypothetical protein